MLAPRRGESPASKGSAPGSRAPLAGIALRGTRRWACAAAKGLARGCCRHPPAVVTVLVYGLLRAGVGLSRGQAQSLAHVPTTIAPVVARAAVDSEPIRQRPDDHASIGAAMALSRCTHFPIDDFAAQETGDRAESSASTTSPRAASRRGGMSSDPSSWSPPLSQPPSTAPDRSLGATGNDKVGLLACGAADHIFQHLAHVGQADRSSRAHGCSRLIPTALPTQ